LTREELLADLVETGVIPDEAFREILAAAVKEFGPKRRKRGRGRPTLSRSDECTVDHAPRSPWPRSCADAA
jgi:hypothetical protein